jgi:CheY-like chemotaxis protein
MNILIVEDHDDKFEDIALVAQPLCPQGAFIHRSTTSVSAIQELNTNSWSLLLLDMSIDIRSGNVSVARGGHANLGGLDIIEYLYLFEVCLPTIIITGFDYFEAARSEERMTELVGLDKIAKTAKAKIGENFLGVVRYQDTGWRDDLQSLIKNWSSV